MAESTSAGSRRGKYDLTDGGILNKLLLVAVPIMGTSVIQMTYNLADMFWLGRVGANAVAASGTVGMYLWLSMAFLMLGRMGAEIGVSQNLGRGDRETARDYGQTAFTLAAIIGIIYGAVLFFGRVPLVGFFNIKEAEVAAGAESYLMIVSLGIPFTFMAAAVTGIFNGSGNSRVPFFINAIGAVLNMILDPLFILEFGYGVEGAAIATVIGQITASALSCCALMFIKHRPFERFRLFARPKPDEVKQIFKWAAPICVESFLFTFLSMIISRLVAGWSASAMAAQRVGSQVESLSWLIAGGFSSALTAFTGQNFGARKWARIHKGFKLSSIAMSVWGLMVTAFLFFGARLVYNIFLPGEPEVIEIGVIYLRILSACQFLACLEGIAAGAFRGIGKTMPPSISSVASNLLRVVLAYVMSAGMGLDGIWWAISIGAAIRGLWMYVWFLVVRKGLPKHDEVLEQAG